MLRYPQLLPTGPATTTTATTGALNLQDEGEDVVTVGERRGGRCVHRQKDKSLELRVGTLNVGTITGKAGGRDAEVGSPT